jgi:hypothetical protein
MSKLWSDNIVGIFSKMPTWIWLILFLILGFSSFVISKSGYFENEIINLLFELSGAFLTIAIPLEFIRELFYSQIHETEFKKLVGDLFDEKIDRKLLDATKLGLDHIDKSLYIEKLFDELQAGDTLWWLDTFCPGEILWIGHVKRAIQRGVIVNMLILAPDSPLCAMRAKELEPRFTSESFTEQLNRFYNEFKRYQNEFEEQGFKEKLNIVLYHDLLGVPCYIVERDKQAIYAYSSMYLTEPTGANFPHFCWNKGEMCDILFSYVKGKYIRSMTNSVVVKANQASM